MVQDWGFFESKLGPRLGQNLVQDFVLFVFPRFMVLWGILTITKGCIFCNLSGCQKRSSKDCALLVFIFWKKKKDEKNNGKFHKENTEKLCLWVVVNKKFYGFFENRQILFVFGR